MWVTSGVSDHALGDELDALAGADVHVEEALAVAEDHGDVVELELVEEAELESVLDQRPAARDGHVLLAGGRLGLRDRGMRGRR